MFKCTKCEALGEEVLFLRQEIKGLMDRLLALTNPEAYQAIRCAPIDPKDCYGSDDDEMIEYGLNGQKILRLRKPQLPS